MAKSAYIHIPFCAHKCDFCDFAAFAGVDGLSLAYCNTVATEIRERLNAHPPQDKLETLFYGGGTPGHVPAQHLSIVHDAVSEHIGFQPDCELTLETTPQSITPEKAAAWRRMGINRLSIGVQSLNDAELEAMGRGHTAAQALSGIRAAQQAGFDNIAVDLMYGLPEQTLDSWRRTLEQALLLPLKHLSAYGLTLAQNSPLLVRYPRDCGAYADEEQFVQMYHELLSACKSAGFRQYEVSNFSAPGFESRHNMSYWSNDEYLAFGVSAHRYVGGVRSSNFRALKRYMRDYLQDETCERIDENTRAREAIFLGLRMRKGINLSQFESRYAVDLLSLFSDKIKRLSDGGFLTIEDGWLRLTQQGVLVSNLVLAELL